MRSAESKTTEAVTDSHSAEPAAIPNSELPTPNLTDGGSRELLKLAAPLILSTSFMTVQVFLDTILLSHHNSLEMAASFPGMMWFWVLFALPQVTAGYTSTFVAQYTGANRPNRVGPAVWQGIHFSIIAGLVFWAVYPAAPYLISLSDHDPAVQVLEYTYLQCLSFAALPMLIVAAVNGFFSGRGQTWTVLIIDAFGVTVNVALALVLIFGYEPLGFPEMGIAGAGWATVAGSWASAFLGVALFLKREYREQFDTLFGWRPDLELFGRLLRYGGPAGAQMFFDALVFHLFTLFVGRLGPAELGATTLAVRLNMVAFLPMFGLAQAVCIMVGQRLGGDRPDLAEKSTYTGLKWMFGYMCLVAGMYLFLPYTLVAVFESDRDREQFAAIAALVPTLLTCVAFYSLADAVNLTFAFALRGAGDTRFVSLLTFALAWPIMVIPTYFVAKHGGNLYWAWGFATAYIFAMALCFWLRFRTGKWKSMRVIEAAPVEARQGEEEKGREGEEQRN